MKTVDETIQAINELQKQHRAWAIRNFGVQQEYQMLFGIIEELGELMMAWSEGDRGRIVDAIGDVGIYMFNYCNLRKWEASEIWLTRCSWTEVSVRIPTNMIPLMSALAHHQLKGEQNIRGGREHHREELRLRCRNILFQVELVANAIGLTFLDALATTWEKVGKRDWVAHPDDANKVAESGG